MRPCRWRVGETDPRLHKCVSFLILAGIIIAGWALDLATKRWALTYLANQAPIQIIPGWLELRYAENTAVAFSLFRFIPAGPRLIFILSLQGALLAILLALMYVWRAKRTARLVPLAVTIAGAAGNFHDRLVRGYVVDFVHVHYRNSWSYPIFNVADSLIFIGTVLMVLVLFRLPDAEATVWGQGAGGRDGAPDSALGSGSREPRRFGPGIDGDIDPASDPDKA